MQVTPNEVVRGMTANGANVLPNSVVQSAFGGMFGKTLNFVNLKQAIGKLDQWYSDHGVLGQVRTLVWTRGCVDMHGSCILYMIASPNEVLVSYETFVCSCRVLIRLALASIHIPALHPPRWSISAARTGSCAWTAPRPWSGRSTCTSLTQRLRSPGRSLGQGPRWVQALTPPGG